MIQQLEDLDLIGQCRQIAFIAFVLLDDLQGADVSC
jgi:hypothetical protein